MAAERTESRSVSIHWSAILAGGFVALGSWMFLYALGAAIGMAGGQGGPTTWTAVYVLVAPIIALFIGGLVGARDRSILSKQEGALHGVVIWGFSTVVAALVLGTMSTTMVATTQPGALNIPAGYFWAVAGSILASLIAAVLGASMVPRERAHRREVVAPPAPRREVYP